MSRSVVRLAWVPVIVYFGGAAQIQPETDAALVVARALDRRIEQVKDVPDQARARKVHELSQQIKHQPLRLSWRLLLISQIDGEEDADQATLQDSADVLSYALRKLGNGLDDKDCYQNLAELIHSAHVRTAWRDPRLSAALEQFAVRDRELSKRDFSLQDLTGHVWNRKQLCGKVVLVNFWKRGVHLVAERCPNSTRYTAGLSQKVLSWSVLRTKKRVWLDDSSRSIPCRIRYC